MFLRFSRCNLWSGHERDRASAICRFCDTDFVGTDGPGGGVFRGAAELADHVAAVWGPGRERRFVVCTGGEPALQLDGALVDALHGQRVRDRDRDQRDAGAPDGIDWVCMSPKAGTDLVVTPATSARWCTPRRASTRRSLEQLAFDHFLLSPMDGPDVASATAAAIEYCLAHPRWRLSLQTHKLLGIP